MTLDDRGFLQDLAIALDTRPAALRRDEYRTWRINGARGHIYAVPEEGAWYVYAGLNSAQGWTYAKRRLSFGVVTQDGDDEGVIRFTASPTPDQAKVIRSIIRIPKRRHLSPEQRAAILVLGRLRRSPGPEPAS